MFAVVCKCGKSYQLDEKFAGRSVRCRHCGETLLVPTPQDAATVPSSPAIEDGRSKRNPAGHKPAGHYENRAHYSVVRRLPRVAWVKTASLATSRLNRDVAIKELLEDVADSTESQRRFVAEAKITGQLEHPGVVPIYGLGSDEQGKPFLRNAIDRGADSETGDRRLP